VSRPWPPKSETRGRIKKASITRSRPSPAVMMVPVPACSSYLVRDRNKSSKISIGAVGRVPLFLRNQVIEPAILAGKDSGREDSDLRIAETVLRSTPGSPTRSALVSNE